MEQQRIDGKDSTMKTEITRENNLIITSATQTLTLTPLEVLQVADFLAEHRWRFNESAANDWTQEELDTHDDMAEQGAFYQQRKDTTS